MDLHKWNALLWTSSSVEGTRAFCPTHRCKLDMLNSYGQVVGQDDTYNASATETVFVCPIDNEHSRKNEDIITLRRRFLSIQQSKMLKSARVIDLDNIYTPVLKVEPKPKDDRYSVQVEIDETPTGKKLVIYAADRQHISEKTQIFLDPHTDKISFDGTGDLHPNAIFTKVVAYFKDGKKATLEQEDTNTTN